MEINKDEAPLASESQQNQSTVDVSVGAPVGPPHSGGMMVMGEKESARATVMADQAKPGAAEHVQLKEGGSNKDQGNGNAEEGESESKSGACDRLTTSDTCHAEPVGLGVIITRRVLPHPLQ